MDANTLIAAAVNLAGIVISVVSAGCVLYARFRGMELGMHGLRRQLNGIRQSILLRDGRCRLHARQIQQLRQALDQQPRTLNPGP